jgi:hypothetical protein
MPASTNAAIGQHGRPFSYLFGDSLDDASGAYSEAQLNLHGSTAISRDLEGVYRLVQSKDAGQQRRQIHSPLVDEVDSQPELLMEAKGPAHFDLLGHHHVLRDRNIPAEAELNQDAARL